MPTTTTKKLSTPQTAIPAATQDNRWAVYIVRCRDGSLYTGVCTDVQRRLREHNGELSGGARYTRSRRPVALVYSEPCATRQQACRLESGIKSLNRAGKLKLIHANSPAEVAR